MRTCIFFVAVALVLAACSSDKTPPPQTQAAQPAAKTVFDTQLKALQKAKDVQKTVDKQQADADKKLQDDGG
jgi:ABC-type glycerol-3-phosphate transport system substrate-binding protein